MSMAWVWNILFMVFSLASMLIAPGPTERGAGPATRDMGGGRSDGGVR